jgi:hypothetical protein
MRARPRSLALAVSLAVGSGAACAMIATACSSTYAEAPQDASADGGRADDGGGPTDGDPPRADGSDDAPAAPGFVVLAKGFQDLAGISATSSTVYFTARVGGKIHSVPIDGGTVTDFASGGAPSGIVAVGEMIFWTDVNANAIRRRDSMGTATMSLNLDGGTPRAIAGTDDRVVVVVGDEIVSYDLTLALRTSLGVYQMPLHVAVNGTATYWTEGSTSTIWSSPALLPAPSMFTNGEPGCDGIVAQGQGVYWTKLGSGQVRGQTSPAGASTIAATEVSPWALAADDSGVYWLTANGKLRRKRPDQELPPETLAQDFAALGDRSLQGLALTANHAVWLTADGRVLRIDK